MPKQAALFYDYPPGDGNVYGQGRRERIEELTDLYPHVVNAKNFDQHAGSLRDVEVIFATWGMPNLSDDQLAQMPNLKAVFYAAGNVKAFAQQLIDHDIVLVSAWAINAIPVAEMALAQVLLSCRGYYRAVRRYSDDHDGAQAKSFSRTGVFGETVGLIGMGMIGKRLAKHLQDFSFKVIANDPMLSEGQASELGVERVSLEDLFRRSQIVSNHIPDIPSTQNVLTGSLFESMREGATFINTGRGAQIVEPDLIRVLKDRPDLTALLDVTFPEPPSDDSELWTLPNIWISPHVGGSVGDEVVRMADCAIEEFVAWESGKPLRYQVTREVLATMG
ncbi:MAG: hydroxyacid dehydrogenase [SAR202 cluster bacterium]|nr:hydroxyacid dehydrogenase [SAR202 cluster bacterium]MDP6512001.1 hydroxyacid dehydrogenase [SAR202 cluster bacterium]MDP6716040.1 hydroxyacid dehydrogenase [SAR202 cluster bacterium]